MDSKNILEVKNLSKNFGGIHAVKDFSGDLRKSQIVGIIGPNGAGKTTIINLISGIYKPTSGQILFNGEDITGKEPHQITHMGIARTFQNINLFQDMSVLDTILTAYSWQANYSVFESMVSWPSVRRYEKEIREKSMYWLEKVDLLDVIDKPAQSLPYGQQRRVEIARALASDPRVLLLDEPGAGINNIEINDLVDLVKNLHQELDLSIILIDHKMDVIMRLCDWIYVQDFGENIAQGTPEQIQNDPVVIKAYLGTEEVVDA